MFFYLIEKIVFYIIANELHRIHGTMDLDNDDIDKNEVL